MATTSIADAIAAYANAAKSMVGKATEGDDQPAATGTDFASLLKDGANAAIAAGKKSEQLTEQAITGKADLRDVVMAVNSAELTLQTVVAVRDKVVSAYNQILQMPI
jgi:flagellar hook-basal body complex protein FliE